MSANLKSDFPHPSQRDVLKSIEPLVVELKERHLSKRRLWFPNEFLAADAELNGEQLAERDALVDRAKGLPDAIRVSIALNLLTEEGLPHFHRLIAVHMGNESPWSDWNNLWTAEEDRHGCALRDYVRDARIFDMAALEKMQYQYIESGFNPDWHRDPYRLLCYTSLQEKATQMAHANTGRTAGRYEPVIQQILAHIAADEARHYAFYRETFKAVLEADPERALKAAVSVMPTLAMPGHNIDGYSEMSEVVRRAGIYGPREYARIVADLLEYWFIGSMSGIAGAAAKAQDKLMDLPARLERMAEYIESKAKSRTFSFDMIYQRTFELG